MPCSFQIISETQPEIHTMEKFDFLKSIIRSQMILFFVIFFFLSHHFAHMVLGFTLLSRIFQLYLADH